jgi:hypothetical protein
MARLLTSGIVLGVALVGGSLLAMSALNDNRAPGAAAEQTPTQSDTVWTLNLDGVSPKAGVYAGPRATGSAMVAWAPMWQDSLENDFGASLYNTRAIVLVTEEGVGPEVVVTIHLGWEMNKGLSSTGTYALGLGEGEIVFDVMKAAMAEEGASHAAFMSGDGSCDESKRCYPPPASLTITRFDKDWIEGSVSGQFWTPSKTSAFYDTVTVTIVFKAQRCVVNTTRWTPKGNVRECVPIPG